ncbi:MAG: hypothetical protein OXR66_03175 [Candidatus Woesearchaeota archaeon]|nr:hypothetical protein [Candidatus Woesearchaeota archaeon]
MQLADLAEIPHVSDSGIVLAIGEQKAMAALFDMSFENTPYVLACFRGEEELEVAFATELPRGALRRVHHTICKGNQRGMGRELHYPNFSVAAYRAKKGDDVEPRSGFSPSTVHRFQVRSDDDVVTWDTLFGFANDCDSRIFSELPSKQYTTWNKIQDFWKQRARTITTLPEYINS